MEFSTSGGRIRMLPERVPFICEVRIKPSFAPMIVDGREVRDVLWLECGCCCIVVELDGREWPVRC